MKVLKTVDSGHNTDYISVSSHLLNQAALAWRHALPTETVVLRLMSLFVSSPVSLPSFMAGFWAFLQL